MGVVSLWPFYAAMFAVSIPVCWKLATRVTDHD